MYLCTIVYDYIILYYILFSNMTKKMEEDANILLSEYADDYDDQVCTIYIITYIIKE